MNDAVIAINGSEVPVLKVKEVDKSLTQVYTWKTGTSFFLSKKEWLVAETYLKTRSYAECEKALRKEGFDRTWQSCRRWLERDHVKKWMMEKLEESGVYAGWSKEHWFKVMTDHLSGKIRLKNGDLYGMKLIAEYKGWGEVQGGGVVNNINILQANGKE